MSKFITFEGIDASGKSTQAKILYKILKKQKKKVIISREPGGTKFSEKIRRIVVKDNIQPLSELFLFYAARSEHFEKIKKYLKKKYIVICDRYIHSTYVYQQHQQKIERKFIHLLQNKIGRYSYPDLTFFIDISSVEAKKRLKLRKNKDKFDNYSLKKMNFLRKAYLKECKNGKNIIKLDGNKKKNQITKEILNILVKKKIINDEN